MGTPDSHPSLDRREKTAKWLDAKMAIAEIADRLGRDAATIYRDN
ncbi:helix-turn-helix domain protein (plasmid) [Antarctobacter heliothermus]|uniref:Helix-turn-helix domain protein n=1 Tax=Antarctobacter heliothermus TaxID=74033 RepID=A0A222EAV4_9RHOB|nr:helix-turn-helix domain protein [Antarctobacter heliothermus]